LHSEDHYKNDKLEGISKIYDNEGQIRYITRYKKGRKINRKAYDKDGKLKFDFDYPPPE